MKTSNLKLFERYFNRQMDEKERIIFEKRLDNEEPLKSEFEEYKAIYEAIGDKESVELRKQLKRIGISYRENKEKGGAERNLYSFFWIAALLIICLSVVSITYLLVNSSLTSQVVGLKLGAENVQSERYHLEPAYEEMMRYRVRSENFSLESPRDSIVIDRKTSIVFRWHSGIKEPIVLDILNKYGKVIFSSKEGLKSPFTLNKIIPPGIYVFRFRTASETLYSGLFYVV